MADRRRAWWAAAAVLFVVFVVAPVVGFLWELAAEPSVGNAIGGLAALAVSLLFGYWLVGGAVRRGVLGGSSQGRPPVANQSAVRAADSQETRISPSDE